MVYTGVDLTAFWKLSWLSACLPPTEVRAPDFHLGLGADPEYTLLLYVSQKIREAESFAQCQPASRGNRGLEPAR